MIRNWGTTVAAGLVTSAALVAATALPAHAVVVDTDRPKISLQELDFGLNWAGGAPLNGGHLNWDVAGGVTTPRLDGSLYINNAAGTCARMRLESYDANHAFINSRNGGTVCAPNGALHSWSVNFAAPGTADTTHVHVILQVQNAGGSYSDAGLAIEELN
ncbi:hypothetical protein [Actinoplanes friuliensis]|uniref:Uncharacterized protein n=1 Tax=Actinoplanes friuliensis DSM 7358 TaxID=1246995 RepID=U5VT22_9ACTN|nr:hypothetical protein [Actinoplanes friuliensis]AGZ39962.1 hypothetical protein AFR_08365 [Actinoplanes friuliensis DSM 7358]